MKFPAIVCCSLIVAATAAPAAADAFDRGFRPFLQRQGQGQGQGQGQRPGPASQPGADQPPMPPRDTRAMGEGDHGRMSPDERRQLRRDIQDAGKDIYLPVRQAPADRRRAGRR